MKGNINSTLTSSTPPIFTARQIKCTPRSKDWHIINCIVSTMNVNDRFFVSCAHFMEFAVWQTILYSKASFCLSHKKSLKHLYSKWIKVLALKSYNKKPTSKRELRLHWSLLETHEDTSYSVVFGLPIQKQQDLFDDS